jgi:hypothetical protein
LGIALLGLRLLLILILRFLTVGARSFGVLIVFRFRRPIALLVVLVVFLLLLLIKQTLNQIIVKLGVLVLGKLK